MRWAVLLALSGCTVIEPAPPSVPPADAMRLCAPRVEAPAAPKDTASRKEIAAWSVQLQLAREASERDRAVCADRHAALVEWVRAHPAPGG
jgi:hypothetical protein